MMPRASQDDEPPRQPHRLPAWDLLGAFALLSVILLLGCPPIRDIIVSSLKPDALHWLHGHKSMVSSWLDWTRILFEVFLAVLIGNQIFNDQIRKWFEKWSAEIRSRLVSLTESSIAEDDARERIKRAIADLVLFAGSRGSLWDLPWELLEVYQKSNQLYYDVSRGLPYLGLRLGLLKLLSSFSGQFHAQISFLVFMIILLVKVAKLYLESPFIALHP